MAIWVEATSFEWYCDACEEADGGFESEYSAKRAAERHVCPKEGE